MHVVPLLVTVKVHKLFGFLDAVQQKGLIKYEQGGFSIMMVTPDPPNLKVRSCHLLYFRCIMAPTWILSSPREAVKCSSIIADGSPLDARNTASREANSA